MIARTWSGTVRRADADAYANYIRETGFAEYGQAAELDRPGEVLRCMTPYLGGA